MTANRSRLRLFTALLAAAIAGCGGDDGDPAQAQPTPAGGSQSLNWSGYVKTGLPGSFTRVAGAWVVPFVHCGAAEDSASSTWAGIGGGTLEDPTLVQAGSAQECNDGTPTYYGWWELIPAPAVVAGNGTLGEPFPVVPGDQMAVAIDGAGGVVWSISLRNLTRGWNFTTTLPYSSAGATAEWVQEAPLVFSSDGQAGQAQLSNYGRVQFTHLTANGANPQLTADERVAMVEGNRVISNPSAPGIGGDAFAVCFGSGSCQ